MVEGEGHLDPVHALAAAGEHGADIVDQHVDGGAGAEVLRQRPDLGLAGEIGLLEAHPVVARRIANGLADLGALGGVAPDEHHLGAALGQRPRGDAADPVRRAGDDAQLAFHRPSLLRPPLPFAFDRARRLRRRAFVIAAGGLGYGVSAACGRAGRYRAPRRSSRSVAGAAGCIARCRRRCRESGPHPSGLAFQTPGRSPGSFVLRRPLPFAASASTGYAGVPASDTGRLGYKAYPSEPGLTTCWVCGCHRQDVRLMFCDAQPLERRPPDVPRRLRGALSR